MPESCCGTCEYFWESGCDKGAAGVRLFLDKCKFQPSKYQPRTGRAFHKGSWPTSRRVIYGEAPPDMVSFKTRKGKQILFQKKRKSDA
jgi:hypothetical protein